VVTFAMPHPKLGRGGRGGGGAARGGGGRRSGIRDFAGERLAAFKVPRKVVILDEIPKGATGKLQRIGLAEKLGLGLREGFRRLLRRPGEAAPSRSPERIFGMGDRRACGDGWDMKICIFGAGAIGGYMGAKLAQAGADVSLVARGPHLAAMRGEWADPDRGGGAEHGAGDGLGGSPPNWGAGLRDRHAQGAFGAAGGGKMQPLIGPETTVVSGVNGVPWWYFHKIGGPLEGTRLESVDPGNAQWDGFGPDRVLGCVVYPAAEVSSRG
jgi:hypothetical protein